MNDMIRRSDAIKAFCMDCKGQSTPCEHSDTCKTLNVLRSRKKIPAVESKQGEWICELINPLNAILRCSACGYATGTKYNYCPNCGARMKGADDDTD